MSDEEVLLLSQTKQAKKGGGNKRTGGEKKARIAGLRRPQGNDHNRIKIKKKRLAPSRTAGTGCVGTIDRTTTVRHPEPALFSLSPSHDIATGGGRERAQKPADDDDAARRTSFRQERQ